MEYTEDTTAREAIEAWDRGEPVWTVEMGGMGEDYEQAIQVLAFETVRDNLDQPFPADGDKETWRTWGNATLNRLDDQLGGLTGAMVGAAKNLAGRILRVGYGAALHEMKEDEPERLIQVTKKFPPVSSKR